MPVLNKKLKRGEIEYSATDRLLTLKWQDKREVKMLSPFHNNDINIVQKASGEDISKPKCIVDYNSNMGGVDQTDMLLTSTKSIRKSVKWYKKDVFHILDMTVINA